MKKIGLLVLVLILASCSNDELMTMDNYTLTTADARAIIANVDNSMAIEHPEENLKFEMSEIEEIDGSYYMVAKSGEYISRTLLMKTANNRFQSFGISCTSKACSGTNGCVPDGGNKCTACMGDCTKTVTGDNPRPE